MRGYTQVLRTVPSMQEVLTRIELSLSPSQRRRGGAMEDIEQGIDHHVCVV